MISLLIAVIPLFIKLFDAFSTNEKAKADLKQSLQQWADLHKQDSQKSVNQHVSDQQQEEDLGKEGEAPKP